MLDVEAAFGALTVRNRSRMRFLGTEVRVGTPQFDNTNFFDPTLRQFGTQGPLPIDDSYPAIRHQIWRTTDLAYKLAAEAYARKQSAVQGSAERDTIPDFSDEPVHVAIEASVSFSVEEGPWIDLTRDVSAVFKEFSAIEDGRVRMLIRRRNRYFAATDGSLSRTPDTMAAIVLTAKARGASATAVRGDRLFGAPGPDRLPSRDELLGAARELAEELTALADAEPVDEYIGPVLFEGAAAGTFVYALLGQFLNGDPAPTVAAQIRQRFPTGANPLKRRLGRAVLPAGFRVVDDATLREHGSMALLGHYAVDDQGVPPRRVVIVEDGILQGFLASRTPSKTSIRSTGHARAVSLAAPPSAMPSNLIIEAEETSTTEQLRANLLQLAEDAGLEYGVVVRRLSAEARFAASPMSLVALGQRGLSVPAPTAAFKLYPDGREEPLAAMEFAQVNQRLLRDIVAAGDRAEVTHLIYVSAPPQFQPAVLWRDVVVSIVSPALLVEEIELKRRATNEKPPVSPHPNRDGSIR